MSSPAIQFKGTGWYITDYAQKGKSSGRRAVDVVEERDDEDETKTETKTATRDRRDRRAVEGGQRRRDHRADSRHRRR